MGSANGNIDSWECSWGPQDERGEKIPSKFKGLSVFFFFFGRGRKEKVNIILF